MSKMRNAPLAHIGLKLKEYERRERVPASESFERLVMKFLTSVTITQTIYLRNCYII
jgi:hypothetical protein